MMTKFVKALIIPFLCLSLSSCSMTGLSDDEKCSVVCEIAESCLEQYSNGNRIYIDAKVKDGIYKFSAGL